MFLSFIVPVYNAEAYIEECLQSLLEQDLPKEDYEIICVNDGSRDGSLEVLQKFAREYPNILVIDKENGGVATARNSGLAAAEESMSGSWIRMILSGKTSWADCIPLPDPAIMTALSSAATSLRTA